MAKKKAPVKTGNKLSKKELRTQKLKKKYPNSCDGKPNPNKERTPTRPFPARGRRVYEGKCSTCGHYHQKHFEYTMEKYRDTDGKEKERVAHTTVFAICPMHGRTDLHRLKGEWLEASYYKALNKVKKSGFNAYTGERDISRICTGEANLGKRGIRSKVPHPHGH